MAERDSIPICDYEGSDYRTRFWESGGRNYEDIVERQVLRRLLPATGQRLLEIGAGFGRLSQEYRSYKQVVLLDYSFSQLQYARQQLGDDGYLYVAANAYKLPFREGVFDGATVIRVLHHMADVSAFLQGVRRVMTPQGTFILEYANKRNLKAMLRYALRRQTWSPYDLDPVEFVTLNFDFHPSYIAQQLNNAGFITEKRIPVSFFRLGLLKRLIPAGILARMDSLMQRSGLMVSPSIFTRNQATGETVNQIELDGDAIFACPETGSPLHREGDAMVSEEGRRWLIRDGIYVFKDLEEEG
ncbi:MAG: class I SAM-dependent methyltransferase [Chloroflexi bacterium]|nr:MAG: class I SAM-dependent methyltransferase [Chloroflexota bacterium]